MNTPDGTQFDWSEYDDWSSLHDETAGLDARAYDFGHDKADANSGLKHQARRDTFDPRQKMPLPDRVGTNLHLCPKTDLADVLPANDDADAVRDIENLICFTPGAMILTGLGERPIETLKVGDLVVTRDQGLRAIRWIGSRRVTGRGRSAPIRVKANAEDQSRSGLLVSPQHRLLYTGHRAELLFGESEVLVPAKDLVDDTAIVREKHDTITYIHLMFDHHQVIYASGIASESFHAGDIELTAIGEQNREALFSLFPDLRTAPKPHQETVRPSLKRHEARLLLNTRPPDYA